MTRHDNRERILTVGGSDSSCSVGRADGPGQIQVTLGLSQWYFSQCLPDLFLEFGPVWLKRKIKLNSFACEILRELPLSLDQDRVLGIEIHCIEFYSIRTFLLPENGDQSFGACDQFEFPDRRFHLLVEESHFVSPFFFWRAFGRIPSRDKSPHTISMV